ncbi:MAG: HEAT repeat domain-containing protein [Planctomycetota bacterium]|nr:HEAT repeat domain-containing protein [Planctomycetota bacterium]
MDTRFVILLVCVSCFSGCAQGQGNIERQKKIREAVECNDGRVRIRAIQELGEIVEHNIPAQELLMERLFANDRGVEVDLFDVVRVLARAEPAVVEKIVNRYQNEEKKEEKLKRLLYVLGRMGPKAKPAIPFLLKELERNQADPVMEGCIRTALANVGWDSSENFVMIHADIQNHTERGEAEIWMMSLAGPQKWMSDDLAKELLGWSNQSFTERRDEPILAIILLSALGKIDADTQNRLAAFLKTECEKEGCDEVCMWFGFSLAKSNPMKAQDALRPALRCVAYAMPGDSFWFLNVLVGDILIGSDQRMRKELIKMLDSPDPKVVTGVLWVLLAIGYDAREYAPDVLKILKTNPDEDLREVASQTLAFLAEPRDIPELESIIKKEESEFVRDEIVKAIRIIRLEEQENSG